MLKRPFVIIEINFNVCCLFTVISFLCLSVCLFSCLFACLLAYLLASLLEINIEII